MNTEPPAYASHRAGPTNSVSVYWVGHSLMNAKDGHIDNARTLLEWVGELAESRGFHYESYDHTLYGASLALLWRGSPISYERDVPELLERRRELLDRGDRYDALVMTEGIPAWHAMRIEQSSYWAQKFYCALISRNPNARVYLYEAWSHHDAGDPDIPYPPVDTFDWVGANSDDRRYWEQIADEASTGAVAEPGLGARLRRLVSRSNAVECEPRAPIFLVPVTTVMVRMATRIEEGVDWQYRGRPLGVDQFFSNSYTQWPEGWPRNTPGPADEVQRTLDALPRQFPDKPLDTIHPSDLGIYITTLVHFATLYRQSPVGLPTAADLPVDTARQLQEFVWDVVSHDPRTGVRASPADAH